MSKSVKRATIYLDSQLHKVIKIKSAETDRTVSEIVNEAVKFSLAEDLQDLSAFDDRASEPNLSFEDVLKKLKSSGKL